MAEKKEETEPSEGSRTRSSHPESITSTEEPNIEWLTKQIAKGGGTAFLGNVAGRFFTFLLQILLTRVLGVAAYGLYALGFSVLGIARTVSLLGLQNGVVRFGAMYRGVGDKARLKGTLLSAIGISFVSAVVIGGVLFTLASTIARGVFNEPALIAPLRAFAFALPFYTLTAMLSSSARAFRRIDLDVGISQLFRPLFTLIMVGASFLLGFRLMGAVYGFLFSTITAGGLGLYLLHRIFPEITSSLRCKYEPKRLILYSSTVLLVGMSSLLLTRTDRIMLGILDSAESVGIYNAAASLAMQATLFLTSFNAIFSPMIADLFHQGHMKELERLFKTTTKWIFTLTLPVVLILVLFAKQGMRLFGEGFAAAAPVLISLAIAQLINASVGSVGFMLTMTGRHKIALANSLTLGVLNVILNLLLIPRYGVLGAGVATGASIALINITRLIEVYLLYRVHPYKLSYWKPFVSGIVAIAVWFGIKQVWAPTGWLWLGEIALFGMTYMLLLVILGLDAEDKTIVRALKGRVVNQGIGKQS